MLPKPHTFTKCAFSEGGVKCCERALPVARHCRKHILEVSCLFMFAFSVYDLHDSAEINKTSFGSAIIPVTISQFCIKNLNASDGETIICF